MAGNLYFSNRNSLARCGGGTNDVYVITDVTSRVRPRLVVPSAKFSDRHQGSCGNIQVLFLTSGPHSGDLLLTEAKVSPIARAEAPEFSVIVPLISDEVDEDNWHVVASTDEFLLVTDYENGRILRYDLEGNYIDVFVRKRNVNWITTDSEGLVYATTCSQWWLGSQGFFIFSPEGEQVFTYPIQHAFSIAVLEE